MPARCGRTSRQHHLNPIDDHCDQAQAQTSSPRHTRGSRRRLRTKAPVRADGPASFRETSRAGHQPHSARLFPAGPLSESWLCRRGRERSSTDRRQRMNSAPAVPRLRSTPAKTRTTHRPRSAETRRAASANPRAPCASPARRFRARFRVQILRRSLASVRARRLDYQLCVSRQTSLPTNEQESSL